MVSYLVWFSSYLSHTYTTYGFALFIADDFLDVVNSEKWALECRCVNRLILSSLGFYLESLKHIKVTHDLFKLEQLFIELVRGYFFVSFQQVCYWCAKITPDFYMLLFKNSAALSKFCCFVKNTFWHPVCPVLGFKSCTSTHLCLPLPIGPANEYPDWCTALSFVGLVQSIK